MCQPDYTTTSLDAALVRLVRPGGRIVSVTNHVEVPHESRVAAAHVLVRNDPRDLESLVALVDDGAIELAVTEHHALAELSGLHRRGENGEIRGRVVIVSRA
ncbi:zinc-binding dehydrogenase [Amycolatopsis magusensis]|uniref:zinc-binding dehydrogenase n=1 Tax=Amycolatopsis magusensis TaxID=882444 RepID=UPI0024A8A3F7|nr:zinc-binding dehydrogenase [Amycolatopsis magusensis]MDI5978828.1 zinc-binding dehydrogenase [Amycolatopsis magusensis]